MRKSAPLAGLASHDMKVPPGRKLTEVKLMEINQLGIFMSFLGGSHEMMT
jgi:hypothetical protein